MSLEAGGIRRLASPSAGVWACWDELRCGIEPSAERRAVSDVRRLPKLTKHDTLLAYTP